MSTVLWLTEQARRMEAEKEVERLREAVAEEIDHGDKLAEKNKLLRELLRKALDWSEGKNDEPWEKEARAALNPERGE